VDNLALKIGKVNIIGISYTDSTYSGCGQIQGNRCPQTAGTYNKYAGVKQLLLPFSADLLQYDMA
jgi:hypothetical protein